MGQVQSALNPETNGVANAFNPQTNGIGEIVNDIKDGFSRMDNWFGKVENWFENFPQLIKTILWNPINNELIIPSKNFFETVINYINCSIDKIQNFWGCFFWYVVFIFQETLNLIIIGIIYVISILTNINLLPLYQKGLDFYGYINNIFNQYTGLELFIFPYSNDINQKCFVCTVNNYSNNNKVISLENTIKQDLSLNYINSDYNNFVNSLSDNITANLY